LAKIKVQLDRLSGWLAISLSAPQNLI